MAWKKSWPCLKPLRARLLKARTRPLRGPLKLAEVGMTYGAGLLTGAPLQCFGVWMSKGWILCMSVTCTLAFLAEAAFFTSAGCFNLLLVVLTRGSVFDSFASQKKAVARHALLLQTSSLVPVNVRVWRILKPHSSWYRSCGCGY